jgi:penicillin-binding protein
MRKTVISAAALAMTTALAGFAYAAAPGGPTPTDDTSVVSTVAPMTVSDDVNDAPDDSDGRIGGGHGADDVNDAPDDSDGRVGGGHGADDPVGHDVGDDHGSAGHGADDPVGHDVGDDHGSGGQGSGGHGSGGHGSDDSGSDD